VRYIYDRKRNDFQDPIYTIKLKGPEEYSLSLFAKMTRTEKDYLGVSLKTFTFLLPEQQAVRIADSPGDYPERLTEKSPNSE
jgi:hypothetical protein